MFYSFAFHSVYCPLENFYKKYDKLDKLDKLDNLD